MDSQVPRRDHVTIASDHCFEHCGPVRGALTVLQRRVTTQSHAMVREQANATASLTAAHGVAVGVSASGHRQGSPWTSNVTQNPHPFLPRSIAIGHSTLMSPARRDACEGARVAGGVWWQARLNLKARLQASLEVRRQACRLQPRGRGAGAGVAEAARLEHSTGMRRGQPL